jgi:hypothetical protein
MTFDFLPLSKIIQKLSKITPEIIVIDKKIIVIELTSLGMAGPHFTSLHDMVIWRLSNCF